MNWVKLKENTLHYGKFLQDLNNILVLKATAIAWFLYDGNFGIELKQCLPMIIMNAKL